MGFNNFIGNDKVKTLLNNNIQNNNLLHSYMFIGTEGIGKNLFAEEFSKMILCQSNKEKPCNTCKSCQEFKSDNNPDFFRIQSDGKVIKIEQIRQMQEKIIEKPINSGKKVYIINDADLMTKEAQNCLLKTLEEPPEYIVIILVVSNENRIITTVKSRCIKIIFEKIDNNQIKQFLKDNYNIRNITESMLTLYDGSIGKAIRFKDVLEKFESIEEIFRTIEEKNKLEFLKSAEIFKKNKDEINSILDYINVVLYHLALSNSSKNVNYINSIKIVEKIKVKLSANSNYDMCIDCLLLNIWEEVNEENCRCKV